MKKRYTGKIYIILTAVMLTFIACIITGVTYAVIQLTADAHFELDSATNYFSFAQGDGRYYDEDVLTDNQTTKSWTIYNNIINTVYSNPRFDLLVFTDGDTGVTLEGATATVKTAIGGKCHVFRNLEHNSPAVSGSMTVSVALTGATAAENVRCVVLTSSEKNVYVSDFFELMMNNSEQYYNTYYENAFGDWIDGASGTYTVSGTDITIDGIGVFGFYDEANETTTTANALVGNLSADNTELTLDFDSLTLSNGTTIAGSNKFVFTLKDGNYVNDAYGMRIILNNGAITVQYLPYTNYDSFKNLYFLDTITVNSPFTLNIPCRIDLLYSRLILNAELSLSHHYGGSFAISAIPSDVSPIDNENHNLIIDCPRAYYFTGSANDTDYGVQALVTTPANLIKHSDCIDFTLPENAQLLASLIADAKEYILGYLPNFAFNDLIFPLKYQSYGVTYSYVSDNETALDNVGNVTRGNDNATANISVTVSFNGEEQGTAVTKAILIAGTDEDSKIEFLTEMLRTFVYRSATVTDGHYYLDRNVELWNNLRTLCSAEDGIDVESRFLLESGNLGIFIQYTSGASLLTAEGTSAEFDFTADTVTLYSGNTTSAALSFSAVQSIYFEIPSFITEGGENVITLRHGYTDNAYTLSNGFSVYLREMTFAEKTAYLERYVETLYLTGANVTSEIIQLGTDGFYYGALAGGNRIINSKLGATSATYNIYLMSDSDFVAYGQGTPLADLTSLVDKTSSFTISDGTISSGAITVPDGQTLVMTVKFVFDTDVLAESEYTAHREVILPGAGIGGTDYTQYTSGNTFSAYFESLTDGRLIDSTADQGATLGNANRFMPFEAGILLEMRIVNTAAVINDDGNGFCSLVYNSNGNYYQIAIDTDEIPSRNTAVQLYVRFYLDNGQGTQTDISTQYYSFVIPGIYKQERDVTSAAIYARMLEVYDTYNGVYLLVDGANAEIPLFDCSLTTLTGITAADTVSLDGIQLLTNTAEMRFDGIKVASLAPFAEFSTYNLTTLSLDGCSITDAILSEKKNGTPYLYHLNQLNSIDLDNNSVTGLTADNGSAYLYRTVTELSLAEQRNNGVRCLTAIDGVNKLIGLRVFDVSGNAVACFDALVDCDNLTEVTLDDNAAEEFGNKTAGDSLIYYGSAGKINIPVYVALSDKGVTINGDTATLFTAEERLCALSVNAIYVFTTQFGKIRFPSRSYVTTTGGSTYYAVTTDYLLLNNQAINFTTETIDSERVEHTATLTDGDSVYAIASMTVNSTTVYKRFSFTFKEVTE